MIEVSLLSTVEFAVKYAVVEPQLKLQKYTSWSGNLQAEKKKGLCTALYTG